MAINNRPSNAGNHLDKKYVQKKRNLIKYLQSKNYWKMWNWNIGEFEKRDAYINRGFRRKWNKYPFRSNFVFQEQYGNGKKNYF